MTEKSTKSMLKENEIFQWIKSLIIVILIALLVRAFVFKTVRVKGISMESNFQHNDIVGVNELLYKFTEPKRGDVIICTYNGAGKDEYIIKRVIGIPGDEININFNGASYDVYVNDELQDEEYIYETMMQKGDMEYPYNVPENHCFVMGDNRNASADSRDSSVGPVSEDNIVGEVFVRIYPFNKIKLIR